MAQSIMVSRPPRVRPAVAAAEPIDVEHVDTDGRDLRLHVAPTGHRAVRALRVPLGQWSVDLDILAASHRVSVRSAADPETVLVSETVACGASADAVDPDLLPIGHDWSVDGWDLHFTSKTMLGDDAVRAAAEQLEHLQDVPSAIVGRFPGDELALTALVADLQTRRIGHDDQPELAWHSWHLYPGPTPHSVITHTIARPPAQGIHLGKDRR